MQLNSRESSINIVIIYIILTTLYILICISNNIFAQNIIKIHRRVAFMKSLQIMLRVCHQFTSLKNNGQVVSQIDVKKSSRFKLKLKRLDDPQHFAQIISRQHSFQETLRVLNTIISGGSGISKNNFESIFKKYVYYITETYQQQKFQKASLQQKFQFLDYTTSIFEKYGQISSVHLIKTFNKISQSLLDCKKRDQFMSNLQNQLSVLLMISRYNKNKAFALFKASEKRYSSNIALKTMTVKSAFTYLSLFMKLRTYNRLIVEVCIDLIHPQISGLTLDSMNTVMSALSLSFYPINKSFVVKLGKRLSNFLKNQNQSQLLNSQLLLKKQMQILTSLAQIEINMNLSSAYLPQLDSIYQICIFDLSKCLPIMRDQQINKYANLLRRSAYYDQTILQSFIDEIMKRQVREIVEGQFQGQNIIKYDTINMQRSSQKKKFISFNTLCSSFHALALFNYRSIKFIKYMTQLINMLSKTGKIKEILHYKYYSRTIWSLCVLATKQQLVKTYCLFETYFQILQSTQMAQKTKSRSQTYDILNFYYCFLLLKTCVPQISSYFSLIQQKLTPDKSLSNNLDSSQSTLSTRISLTHQQIYDCFVKEAGIPCLKQFQISNLMCDIYIPKYNSTGTLKPNKPKFTSRKQVTNVVVDVHGYHHFMRNNKAQVKGGSKIKQKILKQEGYVYVYIPIDQWNIIPKEQRKLYIIRLMDQIAQIKGHTSKEDALNYLQISNKKLQAKQTQQQNESVRRAGRRIRKTSLTSDNV